MFKALAATTAALVCLTGPQLPAQAYCSFTLDSESYRQCQRMEEIERRQREIQERQDCLARGGSFC